MTDLHREMATLLTVAGAGESAQILLEYGSAGHPEVLIEDSLLRAWRTPAKEYGGAEERRLQLESVAQDKDADLCHVEVMDRQPKRIPGESNPEGKPDEPAHVARESYMGGNDYGIARGIIALVDWRKRRRAARRR